MLLIGLFTKYFLLLMVIQGFIVGVIDANSFKKNKMMSIARKARILGWVSVILGIGLFLLNKLQ